MQPHQNNKFLWIVVILSLSISVISLFLNQYQITLINKSLSQAIPPNQNNQTTVPSDSCGPICQSFIKNAVASSSPANTSSPQPTITPKIVTSQAPQASKITYIPLTGGQTQNTDWVNINNSQVIINFGDYGKSAYASWDAILHVDNSNGTTFARLFDTTHGIAVNGSEISITDTNTPTDIVSGALSFWAGNNTYIVQVKSLNSSTAFIDSGRIKIIY